MSEGLEIIILRRPKRYLERLPKDEQERILQALEDLQADPERTPVKPLVGRPEWSLRVGDLRILLRTERDRGQIIVTRIAAPGAIFTSSEGRKMNSLLRGMAICI